FEARWVGQRGVFELGGGAAGLADQEGRRAREAGVVRRLRVAGDRVGEAGFVARGGPAAEVQPGDLLGKRLQILLGHVFGVLFALLVVEELDVVPSLGLLARGQRRDLLRPERFRFARRRLQVAVFDPQLARAHVLLDQRRQRAEREVLADRALQVAEVLHRDRRLRAAER